MCSQFQAPISYKNIDEPSISTHILRGKVIVIIKTELHDSNDIKIVKHEDHVLIYIPIIKE